MVARRQPESAFGEVARVPQSGDFSNDGSMGLSDDGKVTFAFVKAGGEGWGGRPTIVSGPFDGPYGEAFTPLSWDLGQDVHLDVASSGAAVAVFEHWGDTSVTETVRRPAGGTFGAREDLLGICQRVVVHGMDVDVEGRAAILADDWSSGSEELTLVPDSAGEPRRPSCNPSVPWVGEDGQEPAVAPETPPDDPGPVDPGPPDPGPVDPGPPDPGPVDPGRWIPARWIPARPIPSRPTPLRPTHCPSSGTSPRRPRSRRR